MGNGQLSFSAVRNHSRATDCQGDTLSLPATSESLWECRRLVESIETICAQKPRSYEGQDGSGAISSFLDLESGEDLASQSCIFPFFDRLLRQEVFPGKPKGVAEQLPIDLLALPQKVCSMTELFRTLRIAEEICLKLAFVSRERCEFAPYLLVCLQQHLFTELLPLPRGPLSSKTEAPFVEKQHNSNNNNNNSNNRNNTTATTATATTAVIITTTTTTTARNAPSGVAGTALIRM
ncbi:unnamed protein product [Polarella glacialis]|uniref:Uncharacterized protein n=1 Tax=Polarella glacialis TaxID=89957 RepID=A0A813DFT0_POLGL|nr:unnamed protein product [Polarella glacialis]CAE8735511.1 unnamed protein product [Polarella glacialis]